MNKINFPIGWAFTYQQEKHLIKNSSTVSENHYNQENCTWSQWGQSLTKGD